MLIQQVRVKNFRSIKNEMLNCDDLTILIGRNGSGKSSFLSALSCFYKLTANITEEDFFNRDLDNPIEIGVTFSQLRDDEKELFNTYLDGEVLNVTKRISFIAETGKISQKYYAAIKQIRQFAEIRSIATKSERRKAWNDLVSSSNNLDDIGPTARSADEVDQLMSEYERNHLELLESIEQEQQFFGPPNIGGGRLDQFTRFVLIPAVREAIDEATGSKGAIYQILDMIVMRQVNARKDIQEFKRKFNFEATELYSSTNLTELPTLGKSISDTLNQYAPGSELILDWDEFKPPDIQLPSARATLIEDNYRGEISHKGHGLQRALILTLFQYLATTNPLDIETDKDADIDDEALVNSTINEISPDQDISNVQDESDKANKLVYGPDLILAIEEPELYLHPSRCRYIDELFVQLVNKPRFSVGARNQIICTTHSPYFANLNRFNQIRLIRKNPSLNCTTPNSNVNEFSLDQMRVTLAKICNENPDTFTAESVRARALSIMNSIVSEGFFSNVVVVVEGLSDLGAIWKLQEILGKNWSKLGIVIVPAGSKNNINRPTVVFRGFCIPTYFIFDGDCHNKGKSNGNEQDTITRNHMYLRLADAEQEDFPATQVNDTWAVFKDNMETELRNALRDSVYQELRKTVSDEFGYEEPKDAIKNIVGIARFIELAYQRGYSIPVLERIVEKIITLYENRCVQGVQL